MKDYELAQQKLIDKCASKFKDVKVLNEQEQEYAKQQAKEYKIQQQNNLENVRWSMLKETKRLNAEYIVANYSNRDGSISIRSVPKYLLWNLDDAEKLAFKNGYRG